MSMSGLPLELKMQLFVTIFGLEPFFGLVILSKLLLKSNYFCKKRNGKKATVFSKKEMKKRQMFFQKNKWKKATIFAKKKL